VEKISAIKKEKNMKWIFVLLLIVGIIASLTPAVQAGQKVLWVIPDNPTSYNAENEDDYIFDNTVISDAYLGSRFSSNVTVLLKASVGNTPEDAELVYLKFFVEDAEDASYIQNITIGTAIRIYPQNNTNVDPNPNSNLTPATLTFTDVDPNPPVPAGYGVEYLIGDIPFHGGGDIGNPDPNENEGPFNPDNAENCYIRVPFTINFDTTPYPGFTLYVYAENDDTDVKTAYSHDGGITHVPEFTTIAIPVASILGLLFFFNHRNRKKE
jgi:hypothetical protein